MYCTHCASPMADNAVVCTKCGFAAGSDRKFCISCGAALAEGQTVCTVCGHPVPVPIDPSKQKSRMLAGLLALLCGPYGVHNFYLGNIDKAVAQLILSLIGIFTSWLVIGIVPLMAATIWAIVEGILLFTGKITADANGVPLKDGF